MQFLQCISKSRLSMPFMNMSRSALQVTPMHRVVCAMHKLLIVLCVVIESGGPIMIHTVAQMVISITTRVNIRLKPFILCILLHCTAAHSPPPQCHPITALHCTHLCWAKWVQSKAAPLHLMFHDALSSGLMVYDVNDPVPLFVEWCTCSGWAW